MILDTCKLVSLNVRGINNFRKRRMIYTWRRKQKVDSIFLQETHSKKIPKDSGKMNGEVR